MDSCPVIPRYPAAGSAMTAPVRRIVGLAAMLAVSAMAGTAAADSQVALAPLETVGARSKVAKTQRIIARALGQVPDTTVVADSKVDRALRQTPALRTCSGEASCLAQLGRAVGAQYVVSGEIGGLGDVEIVYLEIIDVAGARRLRSTTVELNKDDGSAARGAAFQLLAPERYIGSLAVTVDVEGASIYIDGNRVARSPTGKLALAVGTHALRVTHPEFRDFVRFIDIAFDQETPVSIELQKFPIVASDMARDGRPGSATDNVIYRGTEPTPWYRRWYAVTGFGAAVLVTSAIVIGVIVDGIDADSAIDVDNPGRR